MERDADAILAQHWAMGDDQVEVGEAEFLGVEGGAYQDDDDDDEVITSVLLYSRAERYAR